MMDFARMALAQLWQVTALIVFVVIVTRLLARNRPHLAYVLWLVVLVKCIAPPMWSSPSGAFSWLQASLTHEASNLSAAAAVIEPPRVAIDFNLAVRELDDSNIVALAAQPYEIPLQFVEVSQQRTPEDKSGARSMLLFVAIWASGVTLALVVTGYRWLHCIWMLWRTPAIHVPDLESLVSELSRRLKVRRRVRVLITSSRIGPAVIGLVRPLIVLPEVVVRGKLAADLEAILAHELIHVRRGDLWLGLLQVASKAVWWFYPLVWWVSRLSTREAERCCDEEVIGELGCDPKRYARSLLEVLELKRTLQPVPAFPGMKPVEVTSQRLERIMKLGQGCHKRTPRWYWVVMLLFAAAALPGAAFIVADDDPQPVTSDLPDLQLSGVATTVWVPDGGTVLLGGTRRLAQSVESPEPLAVASYVDQDVLAAIQTDYDCDEREALQTFGTQLICEARLSDMPASIKDRVRIWQGTITVAATDEEHKRMTAAVERMRKYGVAQISIDLRFVTVPERVMTEKLKDWELIPVDLGDEAAGLAHSHVHDVIDRPWPADNARPSAKSGVTTTTNLPALYKIIDTDAAQQLLEDLQGDKRTNTLQSPRVTLFNGQSARIGDFVQRPFVVGLTSVGHVEHAADRQIRIIECGTVVRLRPLLRRSGKLWLDYDMKVVRIEDVRETTVQAAGASEPVTLQVPKVHEARIESAVEFDLHNTVIIGGLPAEPIKGKSQQLLVLLTAKRINPTGVNRLELEESPTGKLMFGAGVSSDVGLHGQLTIEGEQFVSDKERRKLVSILGPVVEGTDASTVRPSDEQVLVALDELRGGTLPWLHEKERFNVRIVKEKIADYVDPPRSIPTLGKAQLHHTHYKCTVHCSERTNVDWPIPRKAENEITQVVYIDHNHFQVLGGDEAGGQNSTPENGSQSLHRSEQPSIDAILSTKRDISLRDASLSMWLDEIQQNWDVDIVNDIADDKLSVSGRFADTSLQEVLTAVLSHYGCGFRRVNNRRLITRLRYEVVGERLVIRSKESEPVYPFVYNVADLVTIDLNSIKSRGFKDGVYASPHDREFEILIAAITEQVAPDSWEAVGGPAAIKPFPTNLSLVVSQTKRTHQELAVFLRDVREKLGISVAQDPMEKESPRRTARTRSTQVTTRVYNVADLVIPVPPVRTRKDERLNDALADFDTLIDLITSTIAPDTWDEAGGSGAIKPLPTNLSLVISNRAAIHDEVSQLLEQLRRLQEVQVTLETRFIRVPINFLNQLGLDFATADGTKHELDFAGLDDEGHVMLSGSEAVVVLRAVQASRQAASLAAPKITLFNGQLGNVSFAAEPAKQEGTFQFQPVCSDDHRSVRLSFAIGSEANLKQAKVHTIAAGDALLMKVTSVVTSEMLGWPKQVQGVPILSKVPYTSRLFKREAAPAEDMLLLITPHIIVQGEEEQQVNFGGVKPRIIIQEEEEEVLGIEISP